MPIKIVSSSKDEIFYVTPTELPNSECPQNTSCQTLQYYWDNTTVSNYQGFNSSRKLTLMFLNGNHTMSSCFCTRLVFLSSTTYISIVGLNGSVVIHNMDVAFPYVFQLTIDNIIIVSQWRTSCQQYSKIYLILS